MNGNACNTFHIYYQFVAPKLGSVLPNPIYGIGIRSPGERFLETLILHKNMFFVQFCAKTEPFFEAVNLEFGEYVL